MPYVRNKTESVNRFSGRFLVPGLNKVSDQEMEIFMANQHFQAQLELGTVEVVKKPSPDEEPAQGLNLGVARPPEAKEEAQPSYKDKITEVEKTDDVDKLKRWLEEDGRKTVQKAIKKRLAELEAEAEGQEE